MFSEATLESIRERINIVDLVGEYVQLKKGGQAYQGLCPFHSEKSPSFYVHPHKQVFRCFGCQKGGNVFTFLMAIDGLSFPEAVEKLAERTGVKLERSFRQEKAPSPLAASSRQLAALEWASRYFNYLLTQVEEYKFALKYIEDRGIRRETIDRFLIGVAPRGWNTLLRQLQQRKFTFQEIVQAGLVVEREGSESGGYDRFRERLMFPIRNRDGQTVGFGARALKEGDQPKYLNSPESPIFNKRRLFYGMFESQRGIRQVGEAILVEGYMDVVGLYQSGVSNSIATMGTALTEEHCSELKPLTRRVVTVFDPDRAGKDAWHRSVHLFLSTGFFAKDLSLPDGLDPDEYVQKHGSESFHTLCAAAPRQVTKLLKEIAQRGPLSESAVAETLTELTPLLVASRRLPDRASLWDDISLVLGVSVPVIAEIAEAAGKRTGPAEAAKPAAAPRAPTAPSRKGPTINPIDLQFFSACVETPEFFLKTPRERWEGGISDPAVKAWLGELSKCDNLLDFREKLASLVHSGASTDLAAAATGGLFEEREVPKNSQDFNILVETMRKRHLEAEIRSLSAQIKLTARMGDSEEQLRLLNRLQELRSGSSESDLPG
ncbi:DNA primase [bacterium]|nr:DNA primase [bacterium]